MIREREREREIKLAIASLAKYVFYPHDQRERERLNWPLHPWLNQSTSVPLQTIKLVIDWN